MDADAPALGGEERSDEAPRAEATRAPDPEVVAKPTRRQFSAEYRLRIVEEAERCTRPGEVGRLLRREGLYTSHLSAWRKARRNGSLQGLTPKKRGAKPAESNPLTDIAYFLGGSVEIDDRRLWERELVSSCHRQFVEAGVDLDEAGCWDTYRRAAMHGIIITVLGATFSSPDRRGDEMFSTMIRRHTRHCLDVGASEFLR